MKQRIYKLYIAVLLSALLVMMAGCSQQHSGTATDTAAAAGNDGAVTIKVAQTGWGNLEQGLKAAGLDNTPYQVQYSVFQGGNLILEAMAANQVDLGTTSEIPPIFASQAANGGNFKVVAVQQGNTLNQEIVVPQNSPIHTVADLKGKKVAFVKNTTAQYFLLKILQSAGLTWQDIQPVELSTADGLSALISGKVDALASYGNAIISAHQNGATTLASAKHILSGSFLVAAADPALADAAKQKAIADYLNRLNQFYDWTRSHPEQWAQITAAATHQPEQQALTTLTEGEAQRPSRIVAISAAAIASEQDVADTFANAGILPAKIDVQKFWSDVLSKQLPAAAANSK
ncbi:ABC transporter substrate-binding protein [Paenibacillus campi]|uniref:ABC transporter substrate-binding protein n=1 Tax=Paenibacillus campi TaxID=3106031 RepID=UPI002AFF644D|nr:ABC transporter substrate-binding protein [Paenibacillus sp. SGZ-1014]